MMYRNDLIKGKMAQLEVSVDALAEKTKLAPNTISKIRQGMDTRISTLAAIAVALDLKLSEIVVDANQVQTQEANA